MNAETAILERLSNAISEVASVDRVLLDMYKQESIAEVMDIARQALSLVEDSIHWMEGRTSYGLKDDIESAYSDLKEKLSLLKTLMH